MTNERTRPYRHPADLEAVLDLVRARPPVRALDYPSFADLRELLPRAEIQANSRVWLAPDGRLAGFAFNDHYPDFTGMSFLCAPAFEAIEPEMVAWCLENFQSCRQPQAQVVQLSVPQEAVERIALLEAYGFACEDWSLVKMERALRERALRERELSERALSGQTLPPRLPEGFHIRAFRGEAEVAAWVDLHRAAFDTENMTAENHLTWMQVPGYNPALDLVAVDAGGRLAAYVYFAMHPEENALTGRSAASVDSAGTHPAYRGLGLARALLAEGLARSQERGAQLATLTTASDNLSMQGAARAVGFRETGRTLYYAKEGSA